MAALKKNFITSMFAAGLFFTACSKAPPVATAYKESGDFQAAVPDDGGDGNSGGDGGDGGNAEAVQFANEFIESNSCDTCHPSQADLADTGPYDASNVAFGKDIQLHSGFADDWPEADTPEAEALANAINEKYPAE